MRENDVRTDTYRLSNQHRFRPTSLLGTMYVGQPTRPGGISSDYLDKFPRIRGDPGHVGNWGTTSPEWGFRGPVTG